MQTIRNLCTRPLWRVLIVFFFFSIADFFLTWKLIERDASEVIESNPLAATVLTAHGWLGLAGYKLVLVLTFFALAMVVERRRPMGGLLLLVFACGVHAAVVTSSAFMYFQTAQTNFYAEVTGESQPLERLSLPVGTLTLLNQKPIQAELRLTDEQIARVQQATKKRRALSREMVSGHLDTCQSKLMLIFAMENSLVRDLTPAQFGRLGQLALQKRDVLAFRDGDIAGALDFSDEQRFAIGSLVEKLPAPSRQSWRGQTEGSFAKDDAATNELKAQLLSVLTEPQKTRWKTMLGLPFCFVTGKTVLVTAQATE